MTQSRRGARRPLVPLRAAAIVLAGGLLLAACSAAGAGSTAPSSAPASEAPASTAPASSAPASQAAAVTIQVASSPLGQILTDGDGNTVYVFTSDSANTSSCNDPTCLGTWPPVTVASGEAPQAGAGLTGTLGTITRDDGTVQVTVNQQPIYYFAGDTAPGDTNGQNVGGKWFVVNADGSMNEGTPSAPATPEPTLSY